VEISPAETLIRDFPNGFLVLLSHKAREGASVAA
jgi:hypothetical protein